MSAEFNRDAIRAFRFVRCGFDAQTGVAQLVYAFDDGPELIETVTVPGACSGILAAPSNPLFYTVGQTVYGLWDPPKIGTAATVYYLDVVGYGLLPAAGRRFVAVAPPGTYSVAVRAANPCGLGPPSPFQTVVVP